MHLGGIDGKTIEEKLLNELLTIREKTLRENLYASLEKLQNNPNISNQIIVSGVIYEDFTFDSEANQIMLRDSRRNEIIFDVNDFVDKCISNEISFKINR